jgi:phospho-N-acetylmuramoyl-pentapeptide-transferase
MFNLVLAFLFSVLVGYFVSVPVLWVLKVFRIAQHVREEGPASHRVKAGTPTMGGIAIVITIVLLTLIFINVDLTPQYAALLSLFIGFAVLGFLDDLKKIKKRQNRGLSARQKLFGQIFFASAFAGILVYLGHADWVGGALRALHFDNPYLYFPFIVFVVVGSSNAVNLSDGLDGLAAGVLCIAFVSFGVVAFRLHLLNDALILMISAGAALSFLKFNFKPAEVFMGDVGSLSLGALLAGVAILLHKELLLVVVGGVFVVEALSVIVQVMSFKFFRKRVFRMSPIHHHFELRGMSEVAVVISFYAAAAVFGGLGILLFRIL